MVPIKVSNSSVKMTVLKLAKALKFVEKILERFNMSNCKPKAVPCELGANKASTVL